MKVIYKRGFDDLALRTVRAALGRGGRATRKECVLFIDRAIGTALAKAPEPRPARVKRPKVADRLATTPVDTPDGARAAKERISKLYGRR